MKTRLAFQKANQFTLFCIILLIGVGALVRSTNAGMGCPDWPTCFGKWIPPVQESQLPKNYQVIYAKEGKKAPVFDPVKTWTEYVNRLLGTSLGIIILIHFVYAWRNRRDHQKAVYLSFLAIVWVGLEGWLGSVVVKTDLKPLIVTAHMVLAAVLALTVLSARCPHKPSDIILPYTTKKWVFLCLILTCIQFFTGTNVRQAIDPFIAASLPTIDRSLWAWQAGAYFWIHRGFSVILLLANMALMLHLAKRTSTQALAKKLIYLMGLLVTEIGIGIGLAYGGLPPFLQPTHVVVSILFLITQYDLLGYIKAKPKAG